ncbi:ATP-dependent DNA helicase [Trichonephila clavipes]|nr:ATP-dependent DNA helicase [Trichonephila clavipes]
MAMEFTEGIYNETLINVEDKCLTIANKVLIQVGMPAPTRAEIGLFDVDLRRGTFFLDAPGGTGKTFLIRLILATVRSKNDIALALASSGIAATLLPGGRTAHSALKLPLNIQTIDTPTCNISKTSGMGKETFRQTLPVISRSTLADEINACLKYSTLWRHVHILQLTTNMSVQLQNDRSAEVFSTVTGHWKRTAANR